VELVVAQMVKKFPSSVEPENSLPRPEESTTDHYLESDAYFLILLGIYNNISKF
jgi:hypothetical protein